jgi:hypothetical protein
MLQEMPPAIEGQRDGDRSCRGSNTIHDEATLATLYRLAIVRGRATHCTATQTGLFPWGEHAFWDPDADSIGDSHKLRNPSRTGSAIHDHLRATPSLAVSLLEAAARLDSDTDLARRMRSRASAYIDAFFAAPHDLDAGIFVILSKRSTNEVFQAMPVWGSVYGVWPASYVALTALLGFPLHAG